MQLMHELRYIDTCQFSYEKHLPYAKLKSQRTRVKKKKKKLTRTFVGLNYSGSMHANILRALQTVGERQDSTTLSQSFWIIKPTHGLHFRIYPHKTKKHTEIHLNPFGFKPPQLTNTGGFSLFYCKNTTGNSILKLR